MKTQLYFNEIIKQHKTNIKHFFWKFLRYHFAFWNLKLFIAFWCTQSIWQLHVDTELLRQRICIGMQITWSIPENSQRKQGRSPQHKSTGCPYPPLENSVNTPNLAEITIRSLHKAVRVWHRGKLFRDLKEEGWTVGMRGRCQGQVYSPLLEHYHSWWPRAFLLPEQYWMSRLE